MMVNLKRKGKDVKGEKDDPVRRRQQLKKE